MIRDKETILATTVALDLESLNPGPGEPIKLFGSGMTPANVITVTTGATSTAADACTTAVVGPAGTVEFELPSTTLQFIKATFADGDLQVSLAGNQTAV